MSNTLTTQHKFPYEWRLSDGYPAKGIEKHGLKVFSCFSCGGGSTMGYKLAGYDVIGCNEIDPRMMEVYRLNHNPKHSFLESIVTFKDRTDLPQELYELDILDGSPPCSSFSMAGNREKDWGKEKHFKEGQAKQVLDTLFFDFIDLAEKLQPKVVIAENVKGILLGNAKKYVREIYKAFDKAGYLVQHFLLDASKMGVPQRRERVFFIAMRKDLANPFLYYKDMFTCVPKLELEYDEPRIPFSLIKSGDTGLRGSLLPSHKKLYDLKQLGDFDLSCANKRHFGKEGMFSVNYAYVDKVLGTLTAHKDNACYVLFDEERYLSRNEFILGGTFPLDYNFMTQNEGYLIGMSVPPVMTAQISHQVYLQWLSKI